MAVFGLVVLTIADLALAAVLFSISGFLFGSGPESGHYGQLWLGLFIAFLVFCVAAPIGGFVLRSRGKGAAGFVVTALPLIIALIASVVPPL
jgi:hypothetical protein